MHKVHYVNTVHGLAYHIFEKKTTIYTDKSEIYASNVIKINFISDPFVTSDVKKTLVILWTRLLHEHNKTHNKYIVTNTRRYKQRRVNLFMCRFH